MPPCYNTPTMKKFIIIDGHAIIHRAYHAIPPLTAKDGTIVNAVFGFTSMLLKTLSEFKPDYLAVSFDVSGGTFRDEIYEDYKATRQKADQDLYDQIPLVYDVVNAFDIPIYEKEGFEADDVIGTIANTLKTKHKDIQTIIVTGDQDMLQLVDDDIVDVYLLRRGVSDFTLYNSDAVKEKFTFGPEHIVDYKAFKGDSSDNIPGVKGIGDKTATQLITQIGGIEEIYKQLEVTSSKLRAEFRDSVLKKLDADKENAYMSFELATIMQNVKGLGFKLTDCKTHTFDIAEIEDLFKKFEFFSLLNRIPGRVTSSKFQASSANKKKKTKKVTTIDDNNLKDLLAEIKKQKQFACKEILTNKNLTGFVIVTTYIAAYIELGKLSEKNQKQVFNLFTNKAYTIIGHDLKQLVKAVTKSQAAQVECSLNDLMIASYLINASTRAHDLHSILLRELGEETKTDTEQASLFGINPQLIADQLSMIGQIHPQYQAKLKEHKLDNLFKDMEMPLIPVLAQMETNGIVLDIPFLETMSKDVAKTIANITKKIHKLAEEEFNIASSTQLRDILFNKLDLPTQGIKKGKTGYSTAASELEKLRGIHPIIPLIEEFREVEKLRNTYIDVLPKLVDPATKRIHSTFNQTIAATGRLSSTDPNLQNIPARTELGKKVRHAFVAESGYKLIAADYSQIELRIVASLAKDPLMMDTFKNGKDIHITTAAAINDVAEKDVTKDMRRAAKEVNFGVLYGMGAFGLASRTGIPQWQAKEFIEKYFGEYAGVKSFVDKTKKDAKKNGYVETLFGRRRYIPELASANFQIKAAGERMAVNMPIQGANADIMKLAMIKVQDWIEKEYPNGEVKLLLQVHDELVLEAKTGIAKVVAKKIEDIMANIVKLEVPVIVESHIGDNWGELK